MGNLLVYSFKHIWVKGKGAKDTSFQQGNFVY